MNGQGLSIATLLLSLITLGLLCIWDVDYSEMAEGQAEETFGQNATFLEEVDDTQRQIASATPAQNQTNATEARSELLQYQSPQGQPNLTSTSEDVGRPMVSMVTSGENIYIISWTNNTGNREVTFRASNDNGETFRDMINLSNSSQTDSVNAEIAVTGGKVFVTWQESDSVNGTSESVFRISNDNGLTFGPIMELSATATDTRGERQNVSDLSTYTNSSYGVRIQYPSQWETINGENGNVDGIIDVAGFLSPFQYRLDNYREKFWISFENLRAENISLEGYSRDLIDYKNSTLQDFDLIDYNTDSNILAGYPAYRLVYSETLEDGIVIKEMETGAIVGDRVYYLTYFAEDEKYADFLPVIQDMINSFSIGDYQTREQ